MSEMIFLDIYVKVSILIAVIDVFLAWQSFRKDKTTGRYFSFACVGAAVVDISYLVSILANDYLYMSVMSSIYFITIDFMLLCLLIFTVYFTKGKFGKLGKTALKLGILYAAFEVVVFAVNPFWEIAIHYVPREMLVARYSYQMKPLYWMHLVFTYILVLMVLILLIRKMRKIPREYRAQYGYVILGILVIVLVNAVFLFWPGDAIYTLLDYSICGYSLTAFLLYWSCFVYSTHGMLNSLKTSIFENIGQGIVLFDYNNSLILHNKKADAFLGKLRLEQCRTLQEFLNGYDLALNSQVENESFSQQCYINHNGEEWPLRCDIHDLKNERGQRLGLLFVFSDAELETDLLTGFQDWDSFQLFVREDQNAFQRPAAVAVCDINSLSVINSTMGNHVGDQKIKLLADTMRQCFPKQTYYVRGPEASLFALRSHGSEAEMQDCMAQVKERFPIQLQYAVSMATEETADILQAMQTATKAMRAKKLLDRGSVHSEMLTSLIRALRECDSDTEHHVRRTQNMGAALGRRIGLTDIQQSNLSLLCLLHDIGKIGIPLEILNKPGRLSDEEWKILQTHSKKGYEIANSNQELKGIAEDILHHHEHWDGSGYPDGLSRESIPLLSRVIAVVDAYDAMTNDRAYRPAMPVSKAIAELKRYAGSQFDPFIVSEFLGMLKEYPLEEVTGSAAGQPEDRPTEYSSIPNSEQAANTPSIIVHQVPYSRYLVDDAMMIVSVDENFEKLTGYTQDDIRQRPMNQMDLIPEEDRTEYLCQTTAGLSRSPQVFQEHKLHRKDGTDIYVFCYGRAYYDSAVRAERSEIIIADVTNTYSMKMLMAAEQHKAESQLRYWELTYRKDSLTGLLNHAAFRSDVEQKLLEGAPKAVMLMMDVDKFKEYNDTFGHHKGDELLVLIAHTLLASLREEDRACRMGGDEFAVLLVFDPDVTDAQIRERAQQIFDQVNMRLKAVGEGTGISMGMVIAQPEMTFNQLYEASDKALYQSKETGRGRLTVL